MLHNPHNHLYHQRNAEIRYTMGGFDNMEMAKQYYCQAVKLAPSNMRALYGLLLAATQLASIVSSGFNLDQRLVTITIHQHGPGPGQGERGLQPAGPTHLRHLRPGRQLDLAKTRGAECQQRVHDLIDLKLCSEGVVTALNKEDYEKAAANIHRFLAMDESLLSCKPTSAGSGAGAAVGIEGNIATLHEAEARLKGVVARRFDEAVKDEDLASIERFFKLFPLLGLHEEGLKNFTDYLATKLAANSKKNLKQALDTPPGGARANIILADTLTLLFEGVARIIEIHQPLMETYYGPGKVFTAIRTLQRECDVQAAAIFAEVRRRRGVRDKVAKLYTPAITAREVEGVLGELCLLQARVEMYNRLDSHSRYLD